MRKILLLVFALYASNTSLNAQVINGDNSYGTILATATENQFSLYSKTLSTQPVNVESFRLGLKHNNDENNGFISFYRGMSTSGGFMGFSTNGIERIRIANNGNVGIGNTNPLSKLDISGNLVLRNYENTNAKGSSITFTSYGDDLHGSQIRSYLTYAEGVNSRVGLVLSSYSNGYKDELFLIDGNVGIGQINPQNKLDVKGTIHSQEVKVDMLNWSDFVFKKEYNLPTLTDVEKHINEKGHLENIPSEEEVLKNGINLGEMNAKLLQKIEELTLYMIEMKKENTEMKQRLIKLENK